MAKPNQPTKNPDKPAKEPWSPGMLLLMGIILLAVAIWCGYDLATQSDVKVGDKGWLITNWGGLIAGAGGMVWSFILAGVRSRKKPSSGQ